MEQDIFSDEDEMIAVEADAPAEPVEAEQPEQQEQSEPQGVNVGESPAPVEKAEPELDHAAIIGERRRRQEAEERNKALEQELAALRKPAPAPWEAPQTEAPSIWEDEQGWQDHFAGQVTTQAVNQADMRATVKMSEMLMRQTEPEFDTLKAEYEALERQNPAILQQTLADPHPWRKAVEIVRNYRVAQELGATNVAELEAKIEARIRQEYAQAEPAKPLPTSLAGAQSAKTGGQNTPFAPSSLEDILGR